MHANDDAIVAIATAAGRAGIGIVRMSGRHLLPVVEAVCGRALVARRATRVTFAGSDARAIDEGIAIFFPAPNSYTGEDVLELHAHGGPVVLRMLVESCLDAGQAIGMRIAEPGEFTKRAFLNDKMDLAQAEAVADLIEAQSEAAVRGARASLQGVFSEEVNKLADDIVQLRALVEATLDFAEEEIEFLQRADASGKLEALHSRVTQLFAKSKQGALIREGMKIVLAGRPNVGKSSLLNALAGAEVAIVTPIAGTTRDRVMESIAIAGVVLHVVDTAGLREAGDEVERIGISRSWLEIERADVVVHVCDAREPDSTEDAAIAERLPQGVARLVVLNKADLIRPEASRRDDRIRISATTGIGIDGLRRELLSIAGWRDTEEPVFLARQRHLVALGQSMAHLEAAAEHVADGDGVLELFAEDLRLAHETLSAVTGVFTSDDLLGEIFGRFCIGK